MLLANGSSKDFWKSGFLDDKEVMVIFQEFASPEEAEAYADWLSDNLALLLDESSSSTIH